MACPGSLCQIRARITACSEQTPRPELSSLPSTHSPSLSRGQTYRLRESHRGRGMLQDATLPAPAPCGCRPGPRSPTTAQGQQSNSEKHLLSFQRYLRPRRGLPPIPGYGWFSVQRTSHLVLLNGERRTPPFLGGECLK